MTNLPTAKMKRRANIAVLLLLYCFGAAIIVNLFKISVLQNQKYQEMANARHFSTITIPSHRGSIYDKNGTILAQSATVYKIFVDPSLYADELEELRELLAEKQQNLSEGKLDSGVSQSWLTAEQVEADLVAFLAETLEIEEAEIRDAFSQNTQYEILKTQVESSCAQTINEYLSNIHLGTQHTITEEGTSEEKELTWAFSSITTQSDSKRYYPQNELAAAVIGFTNADGDGLYGIEAKYDEYLTGTDGRVVSAKDAYGNEMPYRLSKTYDAEDGNSLYLTLDMTIQTYVESALNEMVDTFQVANRGCAIVMGAKTGEILAMASTGGFDLNDPYTIMDEAVSDQLALLSGEEYKTAYVEAREKQWKNKTITDTYEPGSVFKVITSASALEEQVITVDDMFSCSGAVVVGDRIMHCWNRNGHGVQTYTQSLTNSCNPAFIEIGRRLGGDLFYQYFQSFGLTSKTGIDLPGEIQGLYANGNALQNAVTLAACSYGQTNTVTPLQMITAFSAAVNGGNLLQPYVVSKVVDDDGNVIVQNDTTVLRQVISKETSETMCTALKAVVENNGGSNAYIKGYSIGGKSGTSQKLRSGQTEEQYEYVASYVCFAPAEDPEIIMLVMADEPNQEIGYYGSTVAVPYARKLMEKILPYMGYYPEYSAEEQENLDVSVPLLEDMTAVEAAAELEELGLTPEIIGEGATVYQQVPVTGVSVAKGGTVYLYTESDAEVQQVQVPYVIGMTLSQANTYLTQAGLNYVAVGASTDRSDAKIQHQSIEAGTLVEKGTVIEIEFVVNDQTG